MHMYLLVCFKIDTGCPKKLEHLRAKKSSAFLKNRETPLFSVRYEQMKGKPRDSY
jgi:hypothetical protein